MKNLSVIILFLCSFEMTAQSRKEDSLYIRENYVKSEHLIPMRDGVKLFTAVYSPKNQARKYPFLMERTPYSADPYGVDNYPTSLPPSAELMRDGYIIVIQDVRGRYMSEGTFQEMTPFHEAKKSKTEIDESSDTFDTIDWLLKNFKNNNGRVGIAGISYPGFYSTAAIPSSHPALKAVSPQAPVTDEFIGDDVYHNGAFFLLDNFSFDNYFDAPRSGPVKDYTPLVNLRNRNAFDFLLDLGPIKNVNDKYFKGRARIWNEAVEHNTYDDYWKPRNIRTHLKDVKPAVMIVGGWFDAEDLFGPLHTYQTIEKSTPANHNFLVMGPWTHGAWAAREWTKFATHEFGSNVNLKYKAIESAFFNFYLKDEGTLTQPEATIFETGSNVWKTYDAWPPKNMQPQKFYLGENGTITTTPPQSTSSSDDYESNPAKPVPYTSKIQGYRDNEYMALDQRFVSTRQDVMVYKGDVLEADVTLSGPITADLFVSTSGTDADYIVKVIDVLPDDEPNPKPNPLRTEMAGMQRLVRAEVFRGKFRNSFEKPEAFVAGQATEVKFALNDVAHTFKKGHRIMIQIQNTWFPLVDRNPQKFVDIGKADAKDFQKATHKIFHDKDHASSIELPVLK